jgi:hypothetical protein
MAYHIQPVKGANADISVEEVLLWKSSSTGMRMGMATGPAVLVNQLNLHTQASVPICTNLHQF